MEETKAEQEELILIRITGQDRPRTDNSSNGYPRTL